jgi:transposase
MYDVMTRLQVHILSEAGLKQEKIANDSGTTPRTVRRILNESTPTCDEVAAGHLSGTKRPGRPMKATQEVIDKIVQVLDDNPDLPSMEILRLSVAWGYKGGRSQMSDLVKKLRPTPNREPVVRFEGLPGEYTQFDFGECIVKLLDGIQLRIQFFAARLKYSRFMVVEIVLNQQAETLVRAVISSLQVFGGCSKEWVFDNPKTVRISPPGIKPVVLHRYLRQLVAEYLVIPTLCAPRSGNQKGGVERLVGYVKNSFLRVRKFNDLADIKAQLANWLQEVNHTRPSDATGVIPAIALADESPYLAKRPVQVSPEDWAIPETVTVTPMGTVPYQGTFYFASARHLGASATMLVRRGHLEIHVGDVTCTHVRKDGAGWVKVQRLPYQRDEVLETLHGARKGPTFRRQCLFELGQPAFGFLTELIHQCDDWMVPCNEIYELLRRYGDGAMLDAMMRCSLRKTFTVAAIRQALKEAA